MQRRWYLAEAAVNGLHDRLAAARSAAAGTPAGQRLMQLIKQALAGWRDRRRQVARRKDDVLPRRMSSRVIGGKGGLERPSEGRGWGGGGGAMNDEAICSQH